LHELLVGQDYQVTVFHSPAEALASFERGDKAVDLLITDKTMPGMSGHELARRLHESASDLPVIMCSGYSSDLSPQEGSQDHIHHLFIKPVDADELLKAIADELALRSPRNHIMR
jgi:CheY-like chemotaxis protein